MQHDAETDASVLVTYIPHKVHSIKEIYSALPLKSDQFRLLLIDGISDTGLVECQLVQVDLNYKALSWIAVSYTWGGQPLDHQVLCHGLKIPVTRSCVDALSNITLRGKAMVWIDQLCVDQANKVEKADQVLLMKSIYRGAGMVLTWLDRLENLTTGLVQVENKASAQIGPVSERMEQKAGESSASGIQQYRTRDLEETIELVTYLGKHWNHHMAKHRRGEPVLLTGMPTSLRAWDHVLAIFSHAYFERRFIIQEVMVRRKQGVLMFDGNHLLLWEFVEGCSRLLMMIKERLATEFYSAIPTTILEQMFRSCETMQCIMGIIQVRNAMLGNTGMTLLELLETCKKFKTTNELDRVFALIGISSDATQKPDYNLPMTKLLPSVARYYILQGKGLRILYNAGLALRASETTVPSWVPTWEFGPTASFNGATPKPGDDPGRLGLAAAGATSLNIVLVGDGSVLLAHGSIIDRIRATTIPYTYKEGSEFVNQARCFVPPNRRTNVEEYNGLLTAFSKPVENKDRFGRVISERLELSLKIMFTPEEILSDQTNGPAIDKAARNAFSDLAADMLMRGRRICVTDQGYVGVVPAIAQMGDWVAILDGMNVAMIVRYAGEGIGPSRAKYHLVGDAYFQGLSKGEALELDDYKNWRVVFELV